MQVSYFERPTFVLFGTSTTQFSFQKGGFGLLLNSHYEVKADILNRGFSGYNTNMLLQIVEKVFENLVNVHLIVIWLGSNDASLSSQGVPLDQFEKNIHCIIDKISNLHPNAKLLLITPQYIDEVAFEKTCTRRWKIHLDKKNENTQKYVQKIIEIGKTKQIPVLNLFEKMANTDYKSLTGDGLHLNAKGNSFLFKELIEIIEREYPQFNAKTMKLPFSEWK